jgi:hypothetical protein
MGGSVSRPFQTMRHRVAIFNLTAVIQMETNMFWREAIGMEDGDVS